MRLKVTAKSNILHHKYTLECLHFNIMYAYVSLSLYVCAQTMLLGKEKLLIITAQPHMNTDKQTGRQADLLTKKYKSKTHSCMPNKENWRKVLKFTSFQLNESNYSKPNWLHI